MTYLTIATAGHIDHGKSALVEALTGTNPDRLPEERARGISIDLGFAHTTTGGVTLSFVDVPGHERFVRTMLAGVGGIDAVLLVVAADESVMPQTREHLDICRLLGVQAGVIALTRCDLADETMQAVAESDVLALLDGTPLATAPLLRVSARTGEGIAALREALRRCAEARHARDADAPARLPIDRAFTVKGFGTVVTGTLWTGTLSPESDLLLWPAGERVRVRGLQVHGAPASRAEAGQRVAVNLASVTLAEVARGHALLGDGAAISSRRLAVELEVLPGAPTLRHGVRMHVHLGTSVVLGRVILPPRVRAESGRTLAAGTSGPGLLRLESPLAARRGDRLVLRTYSPLATVAGAVVSDPMPSVRGGRGGAGDVGDLPSLVLARVREGGGLGCADAELPARCGVAPGVARRATTDLVARGLLVAAGRYWVTSDVLPALGEMVLARLQAAEGTDPLEGGVPRATLRAIGGRRWRPEVADLVLARLAAEGAIRGEDRVVRTAARAVEPDPAESRVLDRVTAAGLKGATMQEVESGEPDVGRKAVAGILARLCRAGQLERVGDLYVAVEHLRGMTDDLRVLARTGEAPAAIEVSWFKERYGLTRRAAIPLLEWLDRTRVTRRQGEARVLVGAS